MVKLKKAKKISTEPVKEPILVEVLETRPCEVCGGDGVKDNARCLRCVGSGKIFKDGIHTLTVEGEFIWKGGVAIKQ
jgi:DnaJ-class molecular chaperone